MPSLMVQYFNAMSLILQNPLYAVGYLNPLSIARRVRLFTECSTVCAKGSCTSCSLLCWGNLVCNVDFLIDATAKVGRSRRVHTLTCGLLFHAWLVVLCTQHGKWGIACTHWMIRYPADIVLESPSLQQLIWLCCQNKLREDKSWINWLHFSRSSADNGCTLVQYNFVRKQHFLFWQESIDCMFKGVTWIEGQF